MSNSDFDIKRLAQLARIDVDEVQEKELEDSIEKVLDFVSQIQKVDVPKVEPKDFFRLTKNRLREDTDPYPTGEFTDVVTRVAPDTKDGYFKVKKIITRDDD